MMQYNIQNLDDMVGKALTALEAGGNDDFPLIDGRIVAVFASPNADSSEDMALGISALPPEYSTPLHSHRAEEFALVLRGKGSITINGDAIEVGPGSLVVTPPNAPHVTTADSSGPMVIYWVYGPAGSENRWLGHRQGGCRKMTKTGIPSNRLWSKAAYSRALRIDGCIEVSGTTATDSTGAVLHAGDMFAQATVVLERICAAIEELGGSVDDVVRTRVFTTDISRWEEIGRAHHAMFGHMELPPVSAFYGVKELLHPEILVEIEASAILPK